MPKNTPRNMDLSIRPRIRAAQACESCRARKQKCGEERPQCRQCNDAKLECIYRDVAPGKSDRTLLHILGRLSRIESLLEKPKDTVMGRVIETEIPSTQDVSLPYRHKTAAHKLLLWPSIQGLFGDYIPDLLKDNAMSIEASRPMPPPSSQPPILLQAEAALEAYFKHFYIMHPFLDEDYLRLSVENILANRLREDQESALVLFVLALGCFPLNYDPLPFFSNAQRIFSVVSQITIEAVQCHLLAGLFYAQLVRPLDSWREINLASTTVSVLLSIPLNPSRQNLVHRAFWSTLILESDMLAELDLYPSGIARYEDYVPFPFRDEDSVAESVRFHFLAQIAIRRLLNRMHAALYMDDFSPQVARELDFQLLQWRDALPPELQWDDNEEPAMDINNARLRAKYYGARYIIMRPFVYEALLGNVQEAKDVQCCLESAMSSCRAFNHFQKPFLTNLYGTAEAQWGNLLVILAAKQGGLGDYTNVLYDTRHFLGIVAEKNPSLARDVKLLDSIHII